KRLRLDVRRVTAWKGVPKGHEGQALAWVPLHKLADYAMPPADIPVVAALTQPDRYLVTPPPAGATDPATPASATQWLATLQRALASGIHRLHLRLPPDTPNRESLIEQAVALARDARAQAFIGGDIELARAHGAGVH